MDTAGGGASRHIIDVLANFGYSIDPVSGHVRALPCGACNRVLLEINDDGLGFTCNGDDCGERIPDGKEYVVSLGRAEAVQGTAERTQQAVQDAAAADAMPAEGKAIPETPATALALQPRKRRNFSEMAIISLLSLIFLCAGLLAAAMSGFANYQAFGAMVDDPLQSRVWAWTGVIASVCSFGGFTFVYWHGSAKRRNEAFRAAVFALAGAATSIVGTQMYMANTERARTIEATTAVAQSDVLNAEIADWRAELDGISSEVRSIEGLEAYISEVERVGRTNDKPYRDALDELGQARRRADLQGRIASARGELATLAETTATAQTDGENSSLTHWFFAAMLEVFSSQGTSIGFVALLVLSGARQKPE